MKSKNIYKKLLVRLPIYLNYLKSLPDSVEYVSATKIGEAVGLGDVLVRKELAKVSSGGKRRVGYLRGQLIVDIEKYLDSNCVINAIVVGVGNLGTALLNYSGFQDAGVNVLAGFDLNTKKPAAKTEKKIYSMDLLDTFCEENDVRIGIISTPASEAQMVCEKFINNDIDIIWNFAPVNLLAPEGITVKNENLTASLMTLRMHMKENY
ncbi:MAG: redox-sensing transcriptional repressor Rex [Ruminococcus sp.]|jgi:redox-sensing transcriptional repressor|nr:redox-sensing transcriptional repressor Rex [Ruminococcus sp.]